MFVVVNVIMVIHTIIFDRRHVWFESCSSSSFSSTSYLSLWSSHLELSLLCFFVYIQIILFFLVLSVCASLSASLSLLISVCLYVCFCLCLCLCLLVCFFLSASLSVSNSVCLSACQSVCLWWMERYFPSAGRFICHMKKVSTSVVVRCPPRDREITNSLPIYPA